VPREAFAAALDQINLIRPTGDLYFTELRAQHHKLRIVPALLRTLSFGPAPCSWQPKVSKHTYFGGSYSRTVVGAS
jgi:hypothetical protein